MKPIKLSAKQRKELAERFLEHFKISVEVLAAAKSIGVSTNTIRNWRKQMPWLNEAMEEVVNETLQKIEDDDMKTIFDDKLPPKEKKIAQERFIRKWGRGRGWDGYLDEGKTTVNLNAEITPKKESPIDGMTAKDVIEASIRVGIEIPANRLNDELTQEVTAEDLEGHDNGPQE